jgi:hypothetical protein
VKFKPIATILFGLVLLAACRDPASRYHAKLISDRAWPVGEARSCSFDREWYEMHCFPATPEGLSAPKYDYLVTADFDKPVQFDPEGWAYDITCRLDSFEHATCRKDSRTKPTN